MHHLMMPWYLAAQASSYADTKGTPSIKDLRDCFLDLSHVLAESVAVRPVSKRGKEIRKKLMPQPSNARLSEIGTHQKKTGFLTILQPSSLNK